MSKCIGSPAEKSYCSDRLMYFADEYYRENRPSEPNTQHELDQFRVECIYTPLMALVSAIDSPHFAHKIERMIAWYNWYITNRFWAFQLLYPLVSFLQVYYSIVLTNPTARTSGDILRSYVDSFEGESI